VKKFAFSLQKILDLRQYAEDQARLELGRAVSVVNALNAELRGVAQSRGRAMAGLASQNEGLLDVAQMQSVQGYISLLDVKKERLIADLAQAELAAQEKRDLYTEAMKKRSVLTKLSERQYEAYKKEKLREEDRFLDELRTAPQRDTVSPRSPRPGL
jgi:flagellar FliJ protein